MTNETKNGSLIAKNGFWNEKIIRDKWNNWKEDLDAQKWLKIMNYHLNEIEEVIAVLIHGYKADLNVQIQIKLKKAVDKENIQIKLVSNKKGFNQIDKRWLKSYVKLWNIPEEVLALLKLFVGEEKPYKKTKKPNRMFLNEMNSNEQKIILDWFDKNKVLIFQDILRGRGQFSVEWVLITQKLNDKNKWFLKNINEFSNFYFDDGRVFITKKGNLKIGKITVQRKGGDAGKETANMLQFKLDPAEIIKE
ncbi:PDDEXK family nuclease [Mycoplasmoides alvi]|uniref:type II R-M system restriction endonuclease n=1 Tax=Mycoplasmoides alvi TaxID=78580 RepID=UPI00051AEBCD|nr:type II R-M system restriction endonuclease [Mycoplasmoides alvi]